jgi:hypothetical protein
MVIDNLNLSGTAGSPRKTNAELSVYPNRVLPLAVARQGFQGHPGTCEVAQRWVDRSI